jgi:hypothetical protein
LPERTLNITKSGLNLVKGELAFEAGDIILGVVTLIQRVVAVNKIEMTLK